MTKNSWTRLATFASGFEADLAMGQLESAGIPAVRNSNDSVGIVGYGFQGPTSHGVTVTVPSDMIDEARAAITLADGTP